MNKSDYYYDLPQELIAQHPIEPRDSSRLLVYERATDCVMHKHFYDLCDLLRPDDVLVINNTKVIPVRVVGEKKTGGHVEFLLHKRINSTDYEVLCRPAKRANVGDTFDFNGLMRGTVVADGDNGERTIRFDYKGVFEEILYKIGEMPLPHYIHEKLENKDRYNTVYAEKTGSSAAPTAGLHFTADLISKLKAKNVEFVEVLLHVGLGTFLPVKCDDLTKHKMHTEYYEVSQAAADKINTARKEGRRIIAVGTTSIRVLETCADDNGIVHAGRGETSIFIYPPYKFKCVDAIITNFHLPESTLIMLISAFLGREKTLELYKTAVAEKYRFFSFGDSMFLQ